MVSIQFALSKLVMESNQQQQQQAPQHCSVDDREVGQHQMKSQVQNEQANGSPLKWRGINGSNKNHNCNTYRNHCFCNVQWGKQRPNVQFGLVSLAAN
jgi:hypothetical protein